MTIQKLELIVKQNGDWIRVKDKSVVNPEQVGEFVDILAPFEKVYDIVRRHAKKKFDGPNRIINKPSISKKPITISEVCNLCTYF